MALFDSRSIAGMSIRSLCSVNRSLRAMSFNTCDTFNLLSLISSAIRVILILNVFRPAGRIQCERKKRHIRCSKCVGTLSQS